MVIREGFMGVCIIAVVKSRDILICKLLAKCREVISLVDFFMVSFLGNL